MTLKLTETQKPVLVAEGFFLQYAALHAVIPEQKNLSLAAARPAVTPLRDQPVPCRRKKKSPPAPSPYGYTFYP